MTKFLRMVVYSYLTARETLLKVTQLSKQEQAEVYQSHIAREGKVLRVSFDADRRVPF